MLTLIPAYGRDYKNQKTILADWNNNKDFIIQSITHPYDGKYANKSDLKKEHDSVLLRYDKMRKIVNAKT